MTIERINEMLNAISENEKARKKLDQLFELKMNGYEDKYSVEELVEAVFNKFCK